MAPALVQNGHANGSTAKLAATAKVFKAIQGHWLSACLGVLMELRIPEILAEKRQITFTELAKAAGVSQAGLDHFYKVLRVTAQYELLDELPERTFAPNDATRELVRGKDATLGHFVDHQINKPKWDAWKALPEAVRTGQVAFAVAHGGLDMHQYDEEPGHEAFADDFQQAMTYFTKLSLTGGEARPRQQSHGQRLAEGAQAHAGTERQLCEARRPQVALEDAYEWSAARCIMDVGGGRGEMLSRGMACAGPGCRGILMDRPWVLDSVDIQGTFEAKGVSNAKSRLQFVAAEVREPFPAAVAEAGVDTLVMKHFLSGFSDADAALILKHCAAVLAPDGRILLLQTLVPEAGDRSHNVCRDGVAPGLFAIEILAQCPGGGWRTLNEWKAMFATAGFCLQALHGVGASMHLMVWQRMQSA